MGITFAESLDRYEFYAQARMFSDEQVKITRLAVGLFARFLESDTDVQMVTADDFRRFLVDLRSRQNRHRSANRPVLSGTTLHTYARVVKTYFTWLANESIISENPLARVSLPRKPRTIPKVYTEEELQAVTAVISNARDRAVFDLFVDSGIRLKELSMLNIGDIDIDKGRVRIVMGKGGKERVVFFNPSVAEELKVYLREYRNGCSGSDPLFVSIKGTRLTPRGIQAMLYRLGDKVNLNERLSPHKLRHTFATLSLKYGGNLEYIRKILGHSDIQTTSEAYLNVQDDDVSSAHRHFSPLVHIGKGETEITAGTVVDEKTGGQPALQAYSIWRAFHVESSHEEHIRQLVEQLITRLILPLAKDSFITELRTGSMVIGKERALVKISDKGEIRYGFMIEDMGNADIFQQSLYSHLNAPGFAEVIPDIISWSIGVSDYLMDCHILFDQVRTAIEHKYNISIPTENTDKFGFTKEFPMLICADAIESAGGMQIFKGFRYKYEESRLYFGGYQIYIGTFNEDLQKLEEYHRRMREECSVWSRTKAIATQRRTLDDKATVLSQILRKFVALKRLPGHCELCV